MGRLETTIFATLGEVRRCGGQAFFDKCLSIHNRMAASSYVPPKRKKVASLISQSRHSGRDYTPACTTAFFLLPSCGSYRIY